MKNYIYLFLLLFCSFTISNVTAQNLTDTLRFQNIDQADTISKIEMLAMYENQSVRLRWAPNQPADWYTMIFSGYTIEKYRMDKETHTPIIDSREEYNVMPWPARQFEPLLNRNQSSDEPMLVAAQCMYGEWESMQGSQLAFGSRAEELNNRYGMALFAADMNWDAASSLGLAWKDENVSPESMYFYKVLPSDTSLNIQNAYVSIETFDGQIPAPAIDHAIESEGVVILHWNRIDHEEYFSAYHIERSTDGKSYSRLLDIPYVGGMSEDYTTTTFSFADSIDNYKKYHYRLIGITPFGTLSSPSHPKLAMGRDKTPPDQPKNIDVTCDATTTMVTIRWDEVVGDDFAGYRVFKSAKFDGNYTDVTKDDLAPEPLKFKNDAQDQWSRNYYKVASIDTAGNMHYSLPFVAAFRDTVGPSQPLGLEGNIDSLGVVTLSWAKGKEKDLRGYYVYTANQADHFYTNLSKRPQIDTIWKDTITLKTFTEKIYYKIAAVDFHSHFSDFSDVIELSKPDTIRPFPPHIVHYRVEKDHILLETSPSKSKDVIDHVLYKRKVGDAWKEVVDFDISQKKYEDRNIEISQYYEYKIVAIDDADLISMRPDIIRIKAVDLSLPEAPEILLCDIQPDDTVLLQWSDRANTNTTSRPAEIQLTFILYRSVNGGVFTTLKRMTNTTEYRDAHVLPGKTYAYKLKSIWPDGRKSPASSIKEVTTSFPNNSDKE